MCRRLVVCDRVMKVEIIPRFCSNYCIKPPLDYNRKIEARPADKTTPQAMFILLAAPVCSDGAPVPVGVPDSVGLPGDVLDEFPP